MNVHRLLKALVVVLAVPLACSLLATRGRSDWDRRWQAGLWRQFAARRQPVNQRFIARYSLGVLCSDGRTAATLRPCRTYNLLGATTAASLATAGLGLVLLAAIAAGGWLARRRRRVLLRAYQAGLRATVAGVLLLALLQGALAVLTLYLLVGGGWPGSLVFAATSAVLLIVLMLMQAALSVTRPLRLTVVGRRLDLVGQPRLRSVIADIAAPLDAEVPDVLVAGTSPGLFVTEAEVTTLDGPAAGRSIYCSLPLAGILSVDEWRALVAHELAHFGGGDEEATFTVASAGAARGIRALESRARGLRAATILPVLWILRFFAEQSGPPDLAAGVERELAADRAAARLVGSGALASALVKVHVFVPAWAAVRSAMDRAVGEGTQYVSVSELFAEAVWQNSHPERLVGIADRALSHPTDILPPLGARLTALGVDPPAVAASALHTRPDPSAASLFGNLAALERDLSEVEHRLLALGRASYEEGRASAAR